MTEGDNAESFSFLSHSFLDQSNEEEGFSEFLGALKGGVHSHSPSVVIKDQKHSYTGLLGRRESPRNSTVYTNLSSDSSKMRASCNSNRIDKTSPFKDFLSKKDVSTSISQITSLFCRHCRRKVPTLLTVVPKDFGFWKSLFQLFSSIQCCNHQNNAHDDFVYICTACGSVLAKLNHK